MGYSCTELWAAFAVYLDNPGNLVGFSHRHLFEQVDGGTFSGFQYQFQHVNVEFRPNTVLVTKGGFAHRDDYMRYFEEAASEAAEGRRFARAIVNQQRTGEDVLFSFVHAFYTPRPSISAIFSSSFRPLDCAVDGTPSLTSPFSPGGSERMAARATMIKMSTAIQGPLPEATFRDFYYVDTRSGRPENFEARCRCDLASILAWLLWFCRDWCVARVS